MPQIEIRIINTGREIVLENNLGRSWHFDGNIPVGCAVSSMVSFSIMSKFEELCAFTDNFHIRCTLEYQIDDGKENE